MFLGHFWAQKWAFLTFCGAEGAARKFLNFKGPKNALKPDFRGFVQWPTFGFSESRVYLHIRIRVAVGEGSHPQK